MRPLRLVTFVTLGTLLIVGNTRASEKEKVALPPPSKASAPPSRGANAASTQQVKKPEGATSKAGSASVPSQDQPAAAASPKGGPAPAAARAASAQAPREETLEEIVARVRRRLALESSPAKRTSPAPPAPAKSSDRVTLVWRPYIVWPDELTSGPSEPASAQSERVTLEWNADGR